MNAVSKIAQIHTAPAMLTEPFSAHGGYERLSVRRFALWWIKNRPIAPPLDGLRHSNHNTFAGVVLYREGPFQVQLFTVVPNGSAPGHKHPNIDSLEMKICGDVDFRTERQEMVSGLLHIGVDEYHTAEISPAGVAFLSFQKWLNGVNPSSVELDWVGTPVDEQHAKDIGVA